MSSVNSKRMLLSFAHSDDETFGMGGVIAKYASMGVEVSLICATSSDKGSIPPALLEKHGSVAAVRDMELECAAKTLGIKQIFKFGYGDSGMMGTPDNDDPNCLWQADENEVVAKIVEIIRQVQPHVVVTFDAFGGYGHPDHIFMHKATHKAFCAASDLAQYPDKGPVYQPQKLYYMTAKRYNIQLGVLRSRLRRQDPRKIGKNQDIDLLAILENVPPTHVTIQVGRWIHQWDEANRCHASQWQGQQLHRWIRQTMFAGQSFARAYPEPRPGERRESDLFADVK